MQRRTLTAILVAIAGAVTVVTFALVADSSAQYLPQDPEYNDVEYWQSNGYEYCVKYDPVDTPYLVPAAPEGGTWDLLIIKAGAGDQANQLIDDPAVGTTYEHSSDKDISHVILCVVTYPPPTTTSTTSTTTEPTTSTTEVTTSTTEATTTTEPTTSTTEPTTSTTEPTTSTTEPTTSTTEPTTWTTEPTTSTTEATTTTTEPTTSTTEATTTTEPTTSTTEATTTTEPATTTTAEVLGTTTIVTVPGDTSVPTTTPPAAPPATVAGATISRSGGGTGQPAPQALAATGLELDRLVTSMLFIAGGVLVIGLARRARRRQG